MFLGTVVDDVLVIVVPQSIIRDKPNAARLLARARSDLGREAVLLSPTRRCRVTFYGRADLADAVRSARLEQARWMRVFVQLNPIEGERQHGS